jgi:DNA-binding GntR family transcriptional regulator
MAKLSNVALREQVHEELANALCAGRFAPGTTVTIRGLAQLLGTSTMPVREAISQFVSERALEMLPNRTLQVPTLSVASLDEVIDVRVAVEGRAAWLAAERMTPVDFSRMKIGKRSLWPRTGCR